MGINAPLCFNVLMIFFFGTFFRYVSLLLMSRNSRYFSNEDFFNLPWEKSFSRFLSAPPANSSDENLLTELLRLLSTLLKLFKESTCEIGVIWITLWIISL